MMQQIMSSDLLIAYVGTPSLGVGAGLECATAKGVPIILLYEKGARVSRIVRGIPTVIAGIQFSDCKDALTQLKSVLYQWQQSGDSV
jgi:hypothetical protein